MGTKVWASVVGIGVLVAGAGLFWFFGGDAPAEVDLAATASSTASEEATGTSTAAAPTEATASIEGTWSVDTTVGTFTLEDTTTASFVGFRVEEVLDGIGSNTAVGRTPNVVGSIFIQGTTLTSGEITGDLTAVISDESRRDDHIQETLNTSSNPNAVFVLTDPIELGNEAGAGERISVTANGNLTINGATNSEEFQVEAELIDGMILVTATAEIAFPDYGITAPTGALILSVEDHGIIEVQLWLSR